MNARRISVVVGAGLIALIGLFAFAGNSESLNQNRVLGRRVPQLQGQTLTGESYNIDNSRGEWILVNFFATWCVGCVREHPELVELEAWGKDNNLHVVSVVFDDDPDRVAEFFAKQGGNWPLLSDASAAVDFQIAQVPESFLVSPSGLVVQHVIGGLKADEIIEAIETS